MIAALNNTSALGVAFRSGELVYSLRGKYISHTKLISHGYSGVRVLMPMRS